MTTGWGREWGNRLDQALMAWSMRHPYPRSRTVHPSASPRAVEVLGVEVLHPRDPAVLGVTARIGDRPAHAVLGLCPPGAQLRALRRGDDPVLGAVEDSRDALVAVDALAEARLAVVVLGAVVGHHRPAAHAVALPGDGEQIAVSFDERQTLTVYPWPYQGRHPGVALMTALDEAGFNHLPAPLALWQHGGRDLGVVQEFLVGSARGDAVALTSLRDLYAAGVAPQKAGGDFASDATRLGTMAARMHLALAEAFGQQRIELPLAPQGAANLAPETAVVAPAMRTHGDFTLLRTARSDHGWILSDCMPGGCSPGTDLPVARSPLADVGDLVWSLGRVATRAAQARDPSGRLGTAAAGAAWAERNAAAFWRGYRMTPGIEELLPEDPSTVEPVITHFAAQRQAEGR